MELIFLKEALFNGAGANAFKLGTVLTGGWFWFRVTGCALLYRGINGMSIDFNTILATSDIDAESIQPPTYISHNSGEVYFYVVRRVNNFGVMEHTFSAAVKVSINSDGDLASPEPNCIFAVKSERFGGSKVRLIWFYQPFEQKSKPACFKVYCDAGAGQIDYENPLATISYAGRRFYSYESNTLSAGTYLFAVKVEDAAGTQDGLVRHIQVQLAGSNPDSINILSTEVI